MCNRQLYRSDWHCASFYKFLVLLKAICVSVGIVFVGMFSCIKLHWQLIVG